MKNINRLARQLLAGAALLALVAAAANVSAENIPQLITVVKVTGNARYSTDNKSWHALKRGDVLKPGSVIQTADNSTVDVLMGPPTALTQAPRNPAPIDLTGINFASPLVIGAAAAAGGNSSGPKSNLIRIFPSSVLGVDKLIVDTTGADEVAETQLDLRAGQIMGNVKKLSAASRYEVKIPNGVAGIRGTIYVVSASGTVYVLEGQVIISYVNAQGQLVTTTVSAGQNFDPMTGPDGKLSTTPAEVEKRLLAIYIDLNGNVPTPSGNFPENPHDTIVHVSAE